MITSADRGRFALHGATAALCLGLVTACGSDAPEAPGSGGSLAAPADPRAIEPGADGAPNRPPVIQSVRLSPREPVPGQPVKATVVAKDADGDPIELAYTWYVNGRAVGGTGPQITLGELDRTDQVSVSVVASDGRGKSEPESVSARIGNRPPRILDLVIHTRGARDGERGEWVVEPIAEDPDGDLIDFEYVWRLAGRVVGDDQALRRDGWTRGDEITVTVVARDRHDASAPVESAPILIGNAAPEITSKPPGLDPSGVFEYQIEAQDPDGDRGLRYSLGESPDGMEIDPFGGLVTWKASIDDKGEHKVEVVVDDRNGATTKQTFFIAVRSKSGSSPASPR